MQYVVRRGGFTGEVYLAANASWGPYAAAKRFATQDDAEKFARRRIPGHKDFGLFPVSRWRPRSA